MTTDGTKTVETRGGGPRIAAALFIVLALAVASVVGTYLFLYPRDTLARLVPAQAIAYAHFRVLPNHDRRITDRLFRVPAGLLPDEAAAFMLAPVGEDGIVRTGLLLSWDDVGAIDDGTRAALEQATATPIDDTTFLIGDMITASRNVSTFADAHRAALQTLRSIGPVQAVFAKDLLTGTVTRGDALYGISLTVIGGRVQATMVPLSTLDSVRPLLGIRVPNDAVPAYSGTGTATASLSRAVPSFDPLTLLLPDVFSAAAASGTPRSRELSDAHDELAALLARPASLDIVPDATDRAGNGFSLTYDDVTMDELRRAIERFLGAAFPESRRFESGDTSLAMNEFVADTGSLFTSTKDGGLALSAHGLEPIFLYQTESAVRITNSSAVSAKMRDLWGPVDPTCGPSTGIAELTIRSPRSVFSRSAPVGPILGSIDVNFLVVRNIGDNSVFLCGLIGGNVDN